MSGHLRHKYLFCHSLSIKLALLATSFSLGSLTKFSAARLFLDAARVGQLALIAVRLDYPSADSPIIYFGRVTLCPSGPGSACPYVIFRIVLFSILSVLNGLRDYEFSQVSHTLSRSPSYFR